MQKTAVVCVSNDLTTDQRVHKTCLTLQKCGYWVIETGRLLPDSLTLERPYFTFRKKMWFTKGPQFYAELNIRLFLYLISKDVDLIFANDLDTLPAAYLVSKLRNKNLIFDAHELFPEVPELVTRPIIKGIWERIENRIFPHLTHSITVSKSISDYYKNKYNIQMHVVRNIPYYHNSKEIKPRISFPGKKIILYQGALNKGRGLEMVLDAMPFIENAMLVIIGDGDIRRVLEEKTKKLKIENKVHFLGKISGDKLYEYTPSADIGLCLLENMGLNYYYSLPNRIFDYLQAGVPVLASRFPEIVNIVEKYNTGRLIDHFESTYLAGVIKTMLDNPLNTEHFDSVAKELCWENEEKGLISVINEL
jgi:glycosyltransferase involved in cell wall biosynthesis